MRLDEDMRKFYSWIEIAAKKAVKKELLKLSKKYKKIKSKEPNNNLVQKFVYNYLKKGRKGEIDKELREFLKSHYYKTKQRLFETLIEIGPASATFLAEVERKIEYEIDEEFLRNELSDKVWEQITKQVRILNVEKLDRALKNKKVSHEALEKSILVKISNPINVYYKQGHKKVKIKKFPRMEADGS